jgi:hypothetical protein
MIRPLSALFVLASLLAAQTPPPSPTPAPERAALEVVVPTFPNATCPIMGKKVSQPLFIDTELGRFWVCCKPCFKKILVDVPAAHKTAYPNVQAAKNTTCPVTGKPIAEGAPEITLQGHRFTVHDEAAAAIARQNSQVTLVKLLKKGVRDVGNATCPLTGDPVAANAFVVIGDAIVHLAAGKGLADVKDAGAVLAKAEELAKTPPPRPEAGK